MSGCRRRPRRTCREVSAYRTWAWHSVQMELWQQAVVLSAGKYIRHTGHSSICGQSIAQSIGLLRHDTSFGTEPCGNGAQQGVEVVWTLHLLVRHALLTVPCPSGDTASCF